MEPVRKGELHPLENPTILRIIFKGSTLSDLKNYRQVCRAWMLESSRAMKTIAKVVVRGDGRDEEGRRGLSAFLAVVENELSTFPEVPPPNTVDLVIVPQQDPRFWTVLGSHIKSLTMADVDFKNAEQFREAIFGACPNLTNLELLCCSVGGRRGEEPIEYVPPRFPVNRNLKTLTLLCNLGRKKFSLSWMEFFSQFPSLEDLEVSRFGVSGDISSLFRSLGVARQHDNSNWNLTNLSLDLSSVHRPQETVEILGNAGFSLMDLKVYKVNPGHEAALRQILILYAGSLKKLELYGCRFNGPMISLRTFFPLSTEIANLRNLEELKLFSGVFDSIGFLRFVPALTKLTITYCDLIKMIRESDVMGIPPLEHCVDVKFVHVKRSVIEPEDIRKLHLWMPNITKLQMSALTNESFASVCEHWPNLEWLEVLSGEMNDCGITGLDPQDVERINREGKSGNWKPITVPRANITSLKNLKRLSLRFGNLGYCSAVHGVQLLPQLQEFHLSSRSSGELIDPEIWDPLLARFPWKSDLDV